MWTRNEKTIGWSGRWRHRRTSQGGGGGQPPPPVSNYSGKKPKICVIKKRFSGNFFGQTGAPPPPPPKSAIFSRKQGRRPPKSDHARALMGDVSHIPTRPWRDEGRVFFKKLITNFICLNWFKYHWGWLKKFTTMTMMLTKTMVINTLFSFWFFIVIYQHSKTLDR